MSSLYGGRLKAKKQGNKARANGVSKRGQSGEFLPSMRAYSENTQKQNTQEPSWLLVGTP